MLRYSALDQQKQDLETEIEKITQFIFATINMLTDTERRDYLASIQAQSKDWQISQESLADAIREVIYAAPGGWFTVAQVRDRLVANGFDFSKYLSNPLASVSTTLKRLVPKDAKMTTIEGVNVFRARNTKEAKAREETRRLFRLYRSVFGENVTDEELQGLLTPGAPGAPELEQGWVESAGDSKSVNTEKEGEGMYGIREPPKEGK